jgi:PleD family two-component response regulator
MTPANTILVVDDNVEAVLLVSRILENEGLRVFGATSGAEAIRLAVEESIDVAVVDVMMPVMNGLEVCAALRASARTRDIALLLLTAKDDVSTRVAAMRLGVSEFLVKPTLKADLLMCIRRQLEHRAVQRNLTLLLADSRLGTE